MRRLLNWLRGGPKLRNRRNGMAWIKGIPYAVFPGVEVLNNRAVKTMRFEDGKWEIEPAQKFAVTAYCLFEGRVVVPHEVITVTAIADEFLEPWKDTGLRDEDVIELFEAPPAPAKSTTPAPTTASLRGH